MRELEHMYAKNCEFNLFGSLNRNTLEYVHTVCSGPQKYGHIFNYFFLQLCFSKQRNPTPSSIRNKEWGKLPPAPGTFLRPGMQKSVRWNSDARQTRTVRYRSRCHAKVRFI